MNIENLFEAIIESRNSINEDEFFETLLNQWVYFHVLEKNGNDTKPGIGNIENVIFTGKDNPIDVILNENELGRCGVIFTNSELAIQSATLNCKIGKMKGKKAFQLFYSLKASNGLYVQANYGHIHLNKAKITEVLNKNA